MSAHVLPAALATLLCMVLELDMLLSWPLPFGHGRWGGLVVAGWAAGYSTWAAVARIR